MRVVLVAVAVNRFVSGLRAVHYYTLDSYVHYVWRGNNVESPVVYNITKRFCPGQIQRRTKTNIHIHVYTCVPPTEIFGDDKSYSFGQRPGRV